ncbi:hypothetical protein HRbin27_01143 [bacterium HR27]|nr:hypothetical protein HRbin27_01143 [bacterium HR27]
MLVVDRFQDLLEVEARDEHHAATGDDRKVHHDRLPVDVEDGNHAEHDVRPIRFLDVPCPSVCLERDRDQVAVGQHGTLRHTGRPSGVLQDSEIVRVAPDTWGCRRCLLEERLQPVGTPVVRQGDLVAFLPLAEQREPDASQRRQVLLDVRHDDMLERRHLVADRLHLGEHERQAQDDLGLRIGELVGELRLSIERVAGHDDRAGTQRTVVTDDDLGAVGQDEGDTVAWLGTEPDECVGEAVDGLVEFTVGDRLAEEADRFPARVASGIEGQVFRHRRLGDLDLPGHAGLVMTQPRSGLGSHWQRLRQLARRSHSLAPSSPWIECPTTGATLP